MVKRLKLFYNQMGSAGIEETQILPKRHYIQEPIRGLPVTLANQSVLVAKYDNIPAKSTSIRAKPESETRH